MNNIDDAIRSALSLEKRTEIVDEKIASKTAIELQLAATIAELKVYKKLYTLILGRFTRILRQS